MDAAPEFSPIRWRAAVGAAPPALELLDQTRLPNEERWLACAHVGEVCEAIRRLAVRGAPAIGIAAAYGLALALFDRDDPEPSTRARFERARRELGATRPTAVNLRWALEAGERELASLGSLASPGSAASPASVDERPRLEVAEALARWAAALHADDVERNRRMAEHGAELFGVGDRALTHCNAGALATGGIGTAIGVLAAAARRGRLSQVWVDETRPLLQGARLTAWELARLGVPHRLVTDSMVGALFARGLVDRVVVGADRIAANGDFANKIGTYTVAVLAARHGVPFHVAAPLSSFDARIGSGAEIPIEERDGAEVTHWEGARLAPEATAGFNLAFDVTPAELVSAIVTEIGVLRPPYGESIARALAR